MNLLSRKIIMKRVLPILLLMFSLKAYGGGFFCSIFPVCGPPQDGHGAYEYDDGTKYVGEWKDGEKHGQGIYTGKSCTYDGEWRHGKRHGQGTDSWNASWSYSKYVGRWADGEHHGLGIYTWKNEGRQGKYEGEWTYGRANGQGSMILPNGNEYFGTWKLGEIRNGWGKFIDPNGYEVDPCSYPFAVQGESRWNALYYKMRCRKKK